MLVICSVPSLVAVVSQALVVVGGVMVGAVATSALEDLVGCIFSFNCSFFFVRVHV